MRRTRGVALAVAALLVTSCPWATGRYGGRMDRVPLSRVPQWVKDAAAIETPDTSADIVWLHEERIVRPLVAGGVHVVYRRAGRLLRSSGMRAIGVQGYSYRTDDRVQSIAAWTLTPEGQALRAVDDEDVDDRPYAASDGYSDVRTIEVTAPGVVAGAVVAFEFVVDRALDLGAHSMLLGSSTRPTTRSRLTVEIPEGWHHDVVLDRGEHLKVSEANGTVRVTGRDLAPLRTGELRPSASELLPLAWVRWWSDDGKRGFADWDAVALWFHRLSEPVLAASGSVPPIASQLQPSDPAELMQAVKRAFRFVARDVRYVALEIGIGGYRPYTPDEVIRDRYGDCKDKTFLLRAILEHWGLTTYAVMVRTRDLGALDRGVPTPAAFDHAIAALTLPEGIGRDSWPTAEIATIGRVLLLDPTFRESDGLHLRKDVQGTTAILVHPEGGELIELPAQPASAAPAEHRVEVVIDDLGQLQRASVVETFGGSRAASVRSDYAGLSEPELRLQVTTDAQSRFPGATVAEHRITGLEDVEQPVVETSTLMGGFPAKRVGDLLLIEPGKHVPPFLSGPLPPPPRLWDLRLSQPCRDTAEVRVTVPGGWVPEELPSSSEIRSKHLVAESSWSFDDSTLVHRRDVKLLHDTVPVAEYAEFREAAQRLRSEEGRGVVFVPAGTRP